MTSSRPFSLKTCGFGLYFCALLLMAVGSTMLTIPVVHPKLNRVQNRGLVSQASS